MSSRVAGVVIRHLRGEASEVGGGGGVGGFYLKFESGGFT